MKSGNSLQCGAKSRLKAAAPFHDELVLFVMPEEVDPPCKKLRSRTSMELMLVEYRGLIIAYNIFLIVSIA